MTGSTTNPPEDFGADYEPEFFLYHSGGPWPRATFSSANDALTWLKGNAGQPYAELFFVTDRDGRRVTFKEPRLGHAHAILDILDRQAGQ
jgi:hypothetical protein